MRKFLLVITTLVLTCVLVLGSAGIASGQETSESRGLFGKVEDISVDSDGNGTLVLAGGETVTLAVATTYHVPTFVTLWQTWGELSDEAKVFVHGAGRVAVLLTEPATDLIAMKVMVISEYPVRSHQVGVVVSIDGDTVTIVNKAGEEVTITLPEGVEVATGEYVTLVAKRFANEARLTAMAAHNIEQLTNRLRGYIEGAPGPKSFDRLSTLLEVAHERHMNVLEGIKARFKGYHQAESEAIEAIQQAIDKVQAHYESALQKRQEIGDRISAGWEEWKAQWSEIEGTVTGVDLDGSTITITPTAGDAVTLTVTASTQLVKDGRLAILSDLAPEDVVRKAAYLTETLEAKAIVVGAPVWEARWSEVRGVITGVDPDEQTVTINPTAGDPVTLKVVASTRIVKNGRLAALGDLAPDDVVRGAVYFAESLEARAIIVGTATHGNGMVP